MLSGKNATLAAAKATLLLGTTFGIFTGVSAQTADAPNEMSQLFEPQLSLMRGSDGELVLHATTLTPNSCYVAREAEALPIQPPVEPPPVPPEVLPVDLPIERIDQPVCLTYVKSVQHRLPLDPAPEIEIIRASVILDGETVGEARISLEDQEMPGESRPLATMDWNAWVVDPELIEPTVHVMGNVVLPSPGYEANLVKADGESEASVLLLELDVEELEGIFPQVVTTQSVVYADAAPNIDELSKARILLPSGEDIALDIDTLP